MAVTIFGGSCKKYGMLVVATLVALCSFQPLFQQSFSSPDDGSDSDNNQSSVVEEEPVLQSPLRKETVSGEFVVELSWSGGESLNQTKAGGNSSRIAFALSFFDKDGFPQDSILYDFIVRNANSEVVERFENQHIDNFGSARHYVTFNEEESNPKAIQVDVVIKSAGSSPVLLNDTATFEIAVVPEFSGVMLTIVASFLVVTIAMIIMQRSMLSRRGNYWIR